MAWAPKYGLKGMIDASVRVKVEANKDESTMKVLPLEFKTGKVPKDQARLFCLLRQRKMFMELGNKKEPHLRFFFKLANRRLH